MERLICLAVGYVCGLFQTGYLVGKMNHIDIRKEGSGNSGTTNALRVLGWKAGIFTFLGTFYVSGERLSSVACNVRRGRSDSRT